MTYVVQTNKLTKTIGEKNLVTNVSMHVKKEKSMDFWVLTEQEKRRL